MWNPNSSFFSLVLASLLFLTTGCDDNGRKNGNNGTNGQPSPSFVAPDFNADSAYHYVAKQVRFGPRVPGTPQHAACGSWLMDELRKYADHVEMQSGSVVAWDGTALPIRNIIASFAPEKPVRIMLSAHWDSRPWADNDPDPSKHTDPVPAANDGASGVGVLLEIARQLKMNPCEVGIDIFLWDVEDFGQASAEIPDTYGYGSQYWTKNLHIKDYQARFGINLDMVGAKGARFPREDYSEQYAHNVVSKVWATAFQLGYSAYFIDVPGNPITDDHLYVNKNTGIPMIDIIDMNPDKGGFFAHWHTTSDNMDNIDGATLKAVGQTVMEVIYREKGVQ